VQRKTYSYVVYDRHYATTRASSANGFPARACTSPGGSVLWNTPIVDGILIRNLELASQLNGAPVSVNGGSVIK